MLGIDFDNTIASYGDLLHRLALSWRLIHPGVKKDKNEIRDHVRRLDHGETYWQKLQGAVYGPQISQATLADGVQSFFRTCTEHGCKVYIVSHKTEYAAHDESHTNLRVAAIAWMTGHRFFEPDGFGLSRTDVFFEATARAKLLRIRSLKCTHVIDDLAETFLGESLPPEVVKIRYNPNGLESSQRGVKIASSWQEITDQVFNTIDWSQSELN